MGIHKINEVLKKYAPSAFRWLNSELFRNTMIAIDTPLWAFQAYCDAYKTVTKSIPVNLLLEEDPFSSPQIKSDIRKKVTSRITYFVQEFMERGITPLFVFDGESTFVEKSDFARKKRKEARETLKAKITGLRNELSEVNPLLRSKEDVAKLRNLWEQSPSYSPPEELPFLMGVIRDMLGCAVLIAPNEGEKMCAVLAARGYASASFSHDTDSYAFGAPILITEIDRTYREGDCPEDVEANAKAKKLSKRKKGAATKAKMVALGVDSFAEGAVIPAEGAVKGLDFSEMGGMFDVDVEKTPVRKVGKFGKGKVEESEGENGENEEDGELVLIAEGVRSALGEGVRSTHSLDSPIVTRSIRWTHFRAVVPSIAFEIMKCNREQFTDFCILMGCDFNTKLPKIGPDRGWKMFVAAIAGMPVQSKRVIEHMAVMKPELPWENLNAERCRSIFLNSSDCEAVISAVDIRTWNIRVDRITDSRLRRAAEEGGVECGFERLTMG